MEDSREEGLVHCQMVRWRRRRKGVHDLRRIVMTCKSQSHLHDNESEREGQNKGMEEQMGVEEGRMREVSEEVTHEKWRWKKMRMTPSTVERVMEVTLI